MIANNLVYANTSVGLLIVAGGDDDEVVNNTIDQAGGDAVRVQGGSSNVHLRNNILWAQDGYDLNVSDDSQLGFTSDYNDLYVTAAGAVGSWQGVARPTLSDWQDATFIDGDSLSQDPLFVDAQGADGILGYGGHATDGRDDDFHPQGLQGSFHGGSLAPVTSLITGLPVFPTATLTADLGESPTIDRGDAADAFALEPSPNGGFINLGNYGGTAQASISPDPYVLVLRPDGGEVWPEGQSFPIRWRTQDLVNVSHGSTVTIDLLQESRNNSTLVMTIAAAAPNDGQFTWVIPDSLTPGSNYLISVTRNDAGGTTGESDSTFTITAPVHIYYVNDGTVNPGDWTTSPGDDGNDGLSPATPKASIQAILEAYHLGSTDVIRVDAGTYDLTANIPLTAADSGVTIEGYNDTAYPGRQAVLDRMFATAGGHVFDLAGATDVTLDHLAITGADIGIDALPGAGSLRLTVSNSDIYGNSSDGIAIGQSDDGAVLTNNLLHDNFLPYYFGGAGINISGAANVRVTNNLLENNDFGIEANSATDAEISQNTAYGGAYPIDVNGVGATVENNTAYNATGAAINGSGALIAYNTAYGSQFGIGASGGIVRDNTVYLNVTGIAEDSNGLIEDNHIFDNSGDGILLRYGGTALGNAVYSNGVGIQGLSLSNGFVVSSQYLISNNLVYANASAGILVQGGSYTQVINNTVDQITGDALDIENGTSNSRVSNNILERGAVMPSPSRPIARPGSPAITTICSSPGPASSASGKGATTPVLPTGITSWASMDTA